MEDSIEAGVNMVYPCNEIQKVAWDVLRNFDHALVLREDDPLLPAVLDVYEKQGIRNGHPQNKMKGPAFKTELATAYPDCRLVVTKETLTVEGMIKIVYDLLKDKLNIAKIIRDQERHRPLPAVRRCTQRGGCMSEVRVPQEEVVVTLCG